MATSLGQAYSILGSAQGAEFKRRRDEERDYYDTQERKARQNMLLGYLVKPIGEQIGAGISDIISTPFKDPVKKLLDSEQARAFKSDINKLNKQKVALAGIQKQITDKHSGDTNSYAVQKIKDDRTREVFAAYKARYTGLTDEAIRNSDTDIGNAFREDLGAALKDVNKEAEDYATSLNNAFTAVGSMSTSKEISDTLERVTPYSKGIVSKVWNMGSSLFRGEPMLGGPSKARMEESFLKARELLDLTTEEVETLSGILKAGASQRTFNDSLLKISTDKNIEAQKSYLDYKEEQNFHARIAAGNYGADITNAYNKLGNRPSMRSVFDEVSKKYGDKSLTGEDLTKLQERALVNNTGLRKLEGTLTLHNFNRITGSAETDITSLQNRSILPKGVAQAKSETDRIIRVAFDQATNSVFREIDTTTGDTAMELLSTLTPEIQKREIINRATFILSNLLEQEIVEPGSIDKGLSMVNTFIGNPDTSIPVKKYTGTLLDFNPADYEAYTKKQPVETTPALVGDAPELEMTSEALDTLISLKDDPDKYGRFKEALIAKGFKVMPYETIKIEMARRAALETKELDTTIPASTVKREVGAAAIPQVLSTLRDLLPGVSSLSLGQTPSEFSSQNKKLAKVTGTPPSMTATTDRAGQQQLLEDITPKNTQTTSEPVPKASGRSLLEVPVETKTELPIVTTTDRKAKPVSKQVAAAFRGTDAPAVDKVRDYLDTTETEITESILSDLAAASKYDPDVIELLRDSYNYEPKDLTLPRYPQFNPSGSVEDKVKFMTSLDRGKAEDFVIDVQASKVMSEDDLNTMIEKYLDILKQGNS